MVHCHYYICIVYIYIYCSIIQVFYILWHVVVYVKMISALTEHLFLIKNKLFFVPSETPQKILQRSRCRCDRNNEIDPLFQLIKCYFFYPWKKPSFNATLSALTKNRYCFKVYIFGPFVKERIKKNRERKEVLNR